MENFAELILFFSQPKVEESVKSNLEPPCGVTERTLQMIMGKLDWAAMKLEDTDNVSQSIDLMNLIKSSSEAMCSLQKAKSVQN